MGFENKTLVKVGLLGLLVRLPKCPTECLSPLILGKVNTICVRDPQSIEIISAIFVFLISLISLLFLFHPCLSKPVVWKPEFLKTVVLKPVVSKTMILKQVILKLNWYWFGIRFWYLFDISQIYRPQRTVQIFL